MDIKSFLKDYRLSQSELAELFGCGAPNVSNIVNGKRSLTGLQLRQLIEKYGYDTISKYADKSEMPAQSVNIDMRSNEVKENNGNLQQGDGNTMSSIDSKMLEVLQKQADVISQQSAQIDKLIDQQNKLISALVGK